MVANLVLAIGLSSVIGYLSSAVGTSLSGWLIAFLLWKNSKNFNFYFDSKFKAVFLKLLLSCFSLSIFMFSIVYLLSEILTEITTKTLAFTLILSTSFAFYLYICKILGLKKSLIKRQTPDIHKT